MATVSLLHFNGTDASTTFTDETGKVWTPYGSAQLDTADKVFGTASGLLAGVANYIETPVHSDFTFGANDPFTIEFRVKRLSNVFCSYVELKGAYSYVSLWGGSSISVSIAGLDAGGGGPWATSKDYGGTLSVGTWYHVAVTRDGSGDIRAFLDGVQLGSDLARSWAIEPTTYIRVGGASALGSRSTNIQIDELRISNTAIWTSNFTPPTSEYGDIGLYQNVVITSPPNVRELINRIAYEASSLEYWDAGQHNLVYLPTHTTVTKTIDANRIDANSITVGYTDRVDLINTMTLWYYHYWAGYSGDAAFRKAIADSDATSITTFGTLESEPLQFQTLLDDDNAQRALRWILTQQKNPRVTVEFTGGYYLTDLRRSNLIQFSFTAGDELDKAFSGLVSTSDKFIITDIVRGTGQIKIKAVQLVAL